MSIPMQPDSPIGYEDGQNGKPSITLTCGFDFAALDHTETLEEEQREEVISLVCEEVRRVFEWVWQPSPKGAPSEDGLRIRSIIACWVFLPQLRGETMTAMAGKFGLKKQSLGRWVDDFKRAFPELKRIQHFRSDTNHNDTE